MEINVLFYLVLSITLYLTINKKINYLFYFLIFSSFFTATSLINFNNTSFSFPFIIGIFFIVKNIILLILKKLKLKIKLNKFLFLFYLFCFFSLFSPFYIERDFYIIHQDNTFGIYNPNFIVVLKHYIYITYCMCIYFFTIIYINNINDKKREIENILKILKFTVIILFFICIYQFVSYKLNLPFDEIFRMNPSSNTQPHGNFLRISGPNGEPSMFAVSLIFLLNIFWFVKEKFLSFLILIMGILSTSSSFVIGVLVVLIITLLRKRKKELKTLIYLGIVAVIILILLVGIYPEMLKLFLEIIDKVQGKGASGSERSESMLRHFLVGIKYPLFGIGFGAARSKDLFTTWLANIGVIGVIFFTLALIKNIKNNFIIYGIISCFFIEFISVPEPYFLYLWIFLGILDSKKIIKNGEIKNDKTI